MTTRVLIINPMQNPPGAWITRGRDTKGNRCVCFAREEANEYPSKTAAEIDAAHFAKTYPKRGNETLSFIYFESED